MDKIDHEIKRLYNEGLAGRRIAEMMGLGKTTVLNRIQRMGISRGNREWQHDKEKFAAAMEKTIAPKRGVPNAKVRKYYVNERFFETIDTEEKAYILGFFQTDGHLIPKPGGITFEISKEDEDILHKIAKCMIDGKYSVKQYRNNAVKFDIHSICIKQCIENLGFKANKTYNSPFVKVAPSLVRHYIRGLIDGDGCISINKDGKLSLTFGNGSLDLVKGVAEVFERITGKPVKVTNLFLQASNSGRKRPYSHDFLHTVATGTNAYLLMMYLYQDSRIYLDRKYERYQFMNKNPPKSRFKTDPYGYIEKFLKGIFYENES